MGGGGAWPGHLVSECCHVRYFFKKPNVPQHVMSPPFPRAWLCEGAVVLGTLRVGGACPLGNYLRSTPAVPRVAHLT